MFVENVYTLFQRYIDEPDTSFMSAAVAQTWLQLGYQEFRHMAIEHDPDRFLQFSNFTLAASSTIPLVGGAIQLMGSAASPRLHKLVRIVEAQTPLADSTIWTPAPSLKALQNSGREHFFLQGTTIQLSDTFSGTLSVYFIPTEATGSSITWTNTGTGTNEYIDDFDDFHPLIALNACVHYMGQDFATNEVLLALRKRYKDDYMQFLQNRVVGVDSHVILDDQDSWGGIN